MTTISHSYNVYDRNGFLKNLNKIAKRYKAVANVVWGTPYTEEIIVDTPGAHFFDSCRKIKIFRHPVTVDFTLEEFRIPGYTYLGCIKDETMMGLITIHGNEALQGNDINGFVKNFETIPCHACERLHTRKIGHIFRKDDTGEFQVYGSTCAKKYFGINFDRILGFFERVTVDFSDGWDNDFVQGWRDKTIDWKFAAKMAYFLISNYGYLSVTKAREEDKSSTADTVRGLHNSDTYLWNEYGNDIKRAEFPEFDVLMNTDYAKDKDHPTDFEYNIQVLQEKMRQDMVNYNEFGIITYMVFNQFFRTEKKEKVEYTIPEWAVKGRRIKKGEIEAQATVQGMHSFNGTYGVTTIYTFVWDTVRFKWFSSKDLGLEVGQEVILTAFTIKDIEDDVKYGKSVVINRATIEGVTGQRAPRPATFVSKEDVEFFERMGVPAR